MKDLICIFACLFIKLSGMEAQHYDTSYVELPDARIHTVLSLPDQHEQGFLALIVAGSGPTDMDGNNAFMKNNSLRLLSDALVDQGIATLRFDKRMVGKSSSGILREEDLSMETYRGDLVRLINHFREKGWSRIVLIGHSEGALTGMAAALQTEVYAFVSLAGPGRSVDELLLDQLRTRLPEGLYRESEQIISSLNEGVLVDSVSPLLVSVFRPSVQPYLISCFNYEPAELISGLNCPVLIVQGDKDLQVSENEAVILADAVGADPIIVPGMNHVLKRIEGGRAQNISSYSNPAMPIHPRLVFVLKDFISRIPKE